MLRWVWSQKNLSFVLTAYWRETFAPKSCGTWNSPTEGLNGVPASVVYRGHWITFIRKIIEKENLPGQTIRWILRMRCAENGLLFQVRLLVSKVCDDNGITFNRFVSLAFDSLFLFFLVRFGDVDFLSLKAQSGLTWVSERILSTSR